MFVQAQNRYGSLIACEPGCADCCQQDLSLLALEIHPLLEAANELDNPERKQVRRAARALRDGQRQACALLDEQGHCRVHPHRPLICRSHGLALLMRSEEGEQTEAELSLCPKNFIGVAKIAGDCVLDLTTMQTALATLDNLAGGHGERQELSAALLAMLIE
ncbi:MAG: YkgJ family cysteine cluster protein [Deltaproteobacteria bacterium]|nr:YkgJ family cysteine cluster protein [Deltaproteobacteria bacterium]